MYEIFWGNYEKNNFLPLGTTFLTRYIQSKIKHNVRLFSKKG